MNFLTKIAQNFEEFRVNYPEIVTAYSLWLKELEANPEKYSKRAFFQPSFIFILKTLKEEQVSSEYADISLDFLIDLWNSWSERVLHYANTKFKNKPIADALKGMIRRGLVTNFLKIIRDVTKIQDGYTLPELQIAFRLWQQTPEAKSGNFDFDGFFHILSKYVGSGRNMEEMLPVLAEEIVKRKKIEPGDPTYERELSRIIQEQKRLEQPFLEEILEEEFSSKKYSIEEIQNIWDKWSKIETKEESTLVRSELKDNSIDAMTSLILHDLDQPFVGEVELVDSKGRPKFSPQQRKTPRMEEEITERPMSPSFRIGGFKYSYETLKKQVDKEKERMYFVTLAKTREQLMEDANRVRESQGQTPHEIQSFSNPTPKDMSVFVQTGIESSVRQQFPYKDFERQLGEREKNKLLVRLTRDYVSALNEKRERQNKKLPPLKQKPLVEIEDFTNPTPDDIHKLHEAGVDEYIKGFFAQHPQAGTFEWFAARKIAEKIYKRKSLPTLQDFPEFLMKAARGPKKESDLWNDYDFIKQVFRSPATVRKDGVKLENLRRTKEGLPEIVISNYEDPTPEDIQILNRLGIEKKVPMFSTNFDARKVYNEELQDLGAGNEAQANKNMFERLVWSISEEPRPERQGQSEEEFERFEDYLFKRAKGQLLENYLIPAYNKQRAEYKKELTSRLPKDKWQGVTKESYEEMINLLLSDKYPELMPWDRSYKLKDRQLKRTIEEREKIQNVMREHGGRLYCPECMNKLKTRAVSDLVEKDDAGEPIRISLKKEYCDNPDCSFNRRPENTLFGPMLFKESEPYMPQREEDTDKLTEMRNKLFEEKYGDEITKRREEQKQKVEQYAEKHREAILRERMVTRLNIERKDSGKDPIIISNFFSPTEKDLKLLNKFKIDELVLKGGLPTDEEMAKYRKKLITRLNKERKALKIKPLVISDYLNPTKEDRELLDRTGIDKRIIDEKQFNQRVIFPPEVARLIQSYNYSLRNQIDTFIEEKQEELLNEARNTIGEDDTKLQILNYYEELFDIAYKELRSRFLHKRVKEYNALAKKQKKPTLSVKDILSSEDRGGEDEESELRYEYSKILSRADRDVDRLLASKLRETVNLPWEELKQQARTLTTIKTIEDIFKELYPEGQPKSYFKFKREGTPFKMTVLQEQPFSELEDRFRKKELYQKLRKERARQSVEFGQAPIIDAAKQSTLAEQILDNVINQAPPGYGSPNKKTKQNEWSPPFLVFLNTNLNKVKSDVMSEIETSLFEHIKHEEPYDLPAIVYSAFGEYMLELLEEAHKMGRVPEEHYNVWHKWYKEQEFKYSPEQAEKEVVEKPSPPEPELKEKVVKEVVREAPQEVVGPFKGEYSFLSNFYPAEVDLDGIKYPTVEHAYQAAKTEIPEEREKIRSAATPGKAKRLGKKVTLRPNWDLLQLDVMYNLVKQKFSHPELTEKLKNTGNKELAEVNTWGDTFWGIVEGMGDNNLGKILMKVRNELNKPEPYTIQEPEEIEEIEKEEVPAPVPAQTVSPQLSAKVKKEYERKRKALLDIVNNPAKAMKQKYPGITPAELMAKRDEMAALVQEAKEGLEFLEEEYNQQVNKTSSFKLSSLVRQRSLRSFKLNSIS